MSTLYLVSTPIGNLEDITLRALRVLREVALIAAEDTRTARKLMSHHGIRSKVLSYNEHNMRGRTPQILDCLQSVGDVALVSEAGTPGISDPGYELVTAALDAGHEVSPVPGPAAPVAAVVASGILPSQFTFLGFLPRRSTERRRLFDSERTAPRPLVAFESPHRLPKTLADILATLGDRRIAVCRELTKVHEEIYRGTVAGALRHFAEPRGEFTLVIAPSEESEPALSDEDLRSLLRRHLGRGASRRDSVTQVAAETGVSRRRVYALAVGLDETGTRPDARE